MDHYLPQGLSLGCHHFFDAIGQLYPYAETTLLVSPEYMEELFDAKKSIIFLSAMLACYPLGLIMHVLPYGKLRHLFSFVTGALLLQICWGAHWIHTPITSLIAYALIQLCQRYHTLLQVQKVVPIFIMTYLAMAHFQHQYTVTNYLGMDLYFTCSQMILTQKLYMLAYNLHDGYLLAKSGTDKDDDDNKNAPKGNNDKNNALTAAKSCSEFALTKCPSLLEFLGYTFCFSTVLVGPSFEFSHYLSACDGSIHYTTTTTTTKDGTHRQQKLQSRPGGTIVLWHILLLIIRR